MCPPPQLRYRAVPSPLGSPPTARIFNSGFRRMERVGEGAGWNSTFPTVESLAVKAACPWTGHEGWVARSSLGDVYSAGGVLVTQSCPTLCNPLDCRPPGFSVHGILQAGILERVTLPFSRESAHTGDGARVSCIAG